MDGWIICSSECITQLTINEDDYIKRGTFMSEEAIQRNDASSEILFLGTGSSAGTPHIYHLMAPPEDNHTIDAITRKSFAVSLKAQKGDPKLNKDYRCNVSIMIRYRDPLTVDNNVRQPKNILVDVGKTFREAACRWFSCNNVRSVDAVVLTHGHADAIFGIDDLRSTQSRSSTRPLDIFQSTECMKVTRRVYDYLYPGFTDTSICYQCGVAPLADQPSPISRDDCPPTQRIKRFVANVNWIEISPFIAFEPVEGFRMLPLPVMHGEDLICMGYIFGGRERVCYLSDVSRVLPETLKILEDSRIDLLIVDSLHYEIKNPVHFSVFDAIELCRQLKPKRTFLIGMAATIDHDEMNEALYALKRSEGLDIQLAYDGLSIQVAL